MKRLAISIFLMCIAGASMAASITLLSGASAPVTGATFTIPSASPNRSHMAILNGASAVSASVTVRGSVDGVHWKKIIIIPLPQTQNDCDDGNMCDGAANNASWPYEQCNLTAISGVGATVDCKAGY